MRIGRRMSSLALMGTGLLTLGIGVAAAREFPRPNPYDLQPGIREEGRYTMAIPGTYGKLWRLPSQTGGGTLVSSMSFGGGGVTTTAAPTMGEGGRTQASLPPVTVPSKSSAVPSLNDSGLGGLPIANMSGSAGSNPVDALESDLRDVARRLNSK